MRRMSKKVGSIALCMLLVFSFMFTSGAFAPSFADGDLDIKMAYLNNIAYHLSNDPDGLRVTFLYKGQTTSIDFSAEDVDSEAVEAINSLVERVGVKKTEDYLNSKIAVLNENYARNIADLTRYKVDFMIDPQTGEEIEVYTLGKYVTSEDVVPDGAYGKILGDYLDISEYFDFEYGPESGEYFNKFNDINYRDDVDMLLTLLSSEESVLEIESNLNDSISEHEYNTGGIDAPYYQNENKIFNISLDYNGEIYKTHDRYYEFFFLDLLHEAFDFLTDITRERFAKYNHIKLTFEVDDTVNDLEDKVLEFEVSFAPTAKNVKITDLMAQYSSDIASLRNKLVQYADADLDALRAGVESIDLVKVYENIDEFTFFEIQQLYYNIVGPQ